MTTTARRAASVGTGVAVGAAVGGAVSMGTATYFAHRIITPEHEKKDDTTVVEVGEGTVTLRATPETTSPGRYGLWLDKGRGHARLGEIVDPPAGGPADERARTRGPARDGARQGRAGRRATVTRRVLGVDEGELVPGPARWNKYFYCGTPRSAVGLDYEDVLVPSDIGDLPAWRVPPAPGAGDGDWAILVHGRSAQREECLRALPVLHRQGFTSLVPMYRNDIGAPPSADSPRL